MDHKTKSLRALEQKMQDIDKDSLRYRILESARNFKSSWIELGQSLYSVWKDKLFKEWGFAQFEAYTAKEIGIKKQTAMRLLRSYYFLEKEEPTFLKKDYVETAPAATLPSFEAIDVLRMAKNKKELDESDYAHLKNEIFEKGRDARDLKKDLTGLIRERKEVSPEEAWEKKRLSHVSRLLSTLKSLRKEAETLKLLPSALLKETSQLIKEIEAQINL
jgi:hypothetical protein